MSEPVSEQKIIVTATERAHPAIRKLARACITLARQLSGEPTPPVPTPPTATPSSEQSEGVAAGSVPEQPHA